MRFKSKGIMLSACMALAALFATSSPASAAAIPSLDLDAWIATGSVGIPVAGPTFDTFDSTVNSGVPVGTLTNAVYFNEQFGLYTYIHQVAPNENFISEFNTGFAVSGFVGIAGYSFSQSAAAGGTGTAADFQIELDPDFTLDYGTNSAFRTATNNFGIGDAITFFFVSTQPWTIGNYNLTNSRTGTGQSFAPVPEPGTIALLGSGLVGLVGAVRRRRNAAI